MDFNMLTTIFMEHARNFFQSARNFFRRDWNRLMIIILLSVISLVFMIYFFSNYWHYPSKASHKLDDKLYDMFSHEPSCERIVPINYSIPAIYVFGDSTVDAGNNNYLDDAPRVDAFPYGIDFNGTTRGRFTNGKTIADYLAMCYDLPFPPPYRSLSESLKKKSLKGVNYASGGCGLLSDTKPQHGCLDMKTQIESFQSTLRNDLPYMIEDQEERSRYLAASMFFISIGSNDFIFNPRKDDDYFGDSLLRQMYSSMDGWVVCWSAVGWALEVCVAIALAAAWRLGWLFGCMLLLWLHALGG
ncbi:hypothetical protein U1Q18_002526 [Sarracenia purpurea var. burkii]